MAAISAAKAGCNGLWFCFSLPRICRGCQSRLPGWRRSCPASPALVPPLSAKAWIEPPDQGPGVPVGLRGRVPSRRTCRPPPSTSPYSPLPTAETLARCPCATASTRASSPAVAPSGNELANLVAMAVNEAELASRPGARVATPSARAPPGGEEPPDTGTEAILSPPSTSAQAPRWPWPGHLRTGRARQVAGPPGPRPRRPPPGYWS